MLESAPESMDCKEKDEELRTALENVEAHYARLVGMEELYAKIVQEYCKGVSEQAAREFQVQDLQRS